MATTPKVLLKRSSVAGRIPSAGDLSYGELAINFADGKIYYKNSSNAIRAFVDSARVQAIADAVEIVAESQLDSAEVTSLVDSAYVQARVPLSYLESLIDSDYVQARQIYYTGFDSDFDARLAIKTTDDLTEGSNLYYTKARVDSDIATSLNDSGNVVSITINNTILDTVDSAYVNARVNAANYLDSAEAIQLIDSAYVQARQITYDFLDSVETVAIIDSHVNKTFVDALNIDADRLDGQHGNYYLDWNNTTNKPTILDLVDVSTQITADVDKAFVDALNVDADTVDGYHAQAFFDAIDSAVDALIDGAPGALDTLNELAQALNDDSNAYNNLLSLIAAKLDSAEAIALIDSAHVRARQDYAYSSLTGVPTNVSTFTNDANYLDSNTVVPIIDSAYIQARQLNFDNLLDSAEVIALVDSAYVQARQDYAYSSLTGVPTNVSQFTNDANYLDSSTVQNVIDATYIQANQITYDFLDSAEVTAIVDSAYVQARQDFAYGSLTGVPTNVSTFTNDANYLDSATVQGVIDSAYIKARTDSAYVTNIIDNATSVFINNVDSAYVQARQITYNTSDFTDSAFVTGLPVSTFTNDANYIATGDSATFASVTTTGDVVVGGNLQVNGTTFTVNSETLAVGDNLIYMNQLESEGSPTLQVDVGWAANVNDNGTYTHVGMFRDATDDTFKVFGNYVPEPDSAVQIDTNHASFELAPFAAKTLSGEYLGFDSDFNTKSTSDLTEGTNLYYTKARADSDIAASLNDSGNTVNITINNTITDTVDSAYVLARVAEAPFLDSADAIQLIDSAYVQARQAGGLDSTNVSNIIIADVDQTFVNALNIDADNLDGQTGTFYLDYNNFTNTPNILDSQNVIDLIDTYSSNYDSANTIGLIDSAYIQARQADIYRDSGFVTSIIDSAYINARTSGIDSAAVTSIIDSAYVAARAGAGTDSATVINLIQVTADSAYIQARQLNETAAQLTQTTYSFSADSGQTSFTGLDVDSGKFQVYLNGLLLPRADYTHNSSKVDLLVAADSADVLEVIKFSGNDTGAIAIQQRHYIYTATSGQTIFTGADDNSATLSYTQGRINVYLNGLLLLDSADYTQNGAGTTVTFTSGVTAGHIVNIQTLSGNTGTFAPLAQTFYEFTADSGQTVFTGTDDNAETLDFSDDKVAVYLNGILLAGDDYTLSAGNKVTLTSAADSGNLLTISKLSGNNIGLDSAQVNALISATPSGTDSASVLTLINDYIVQADSDLTTTSADQVIDTFSATTYRTAKYLVQFSHAPSYHSTEVLLVHDGTTVYMTEYAEVKTDSNLGTIDADISGGNVRLKVTPALTNTGVNVTRINVTV